MNQTEIEDVWRGKWGADFNHTGGDYDWREDHVKKALQFTGGVSVLDVGCAIGKSFPGIERLGIKVSGVELNPESVAEAVGLGRNVVEGNVLSIPFPDGSFDIAYCWGVLTQITPEYIERAVDEMLRVSRLGIVAFDRHGVGEPEDYQGHKAFLYTHDLISLFCRNKRIIKKKFIVQPQLIAMKYD